MSRAAASLLDRQRIVVGWVHSSYDRIINIRTPASRLMTLQGGGRLRAPLALSCAGKLEDLVPALATGAMVVRHIEGVVGPSGALKLRFTQAMEWDGHVRPLTSLTDSELFRNADQLEAWLMQHASGRGLASLLPALRGKDSNLSPSGRKILARLKPLLAGRQASTDVLLQMAGSVLGLGEGLTPSGDDFLAGLLAALHISGRRKGLLPPPAHQLLLKTVMNETSDLSAEFIRCALEGNFAESVVLLVEALFVQDQHAWCSHAACLAGSGHSSGIDAMVGMVVGCRFLSKNKHMSFPSG
ncbi:MAG: DUF2877 domain-containing protein [Desulfobacteraceae bacterium]|nr:DUF2877 domain-containing protein [Desulfobacteraceae bacterium]